MTSPLAEVSAALQGRYTIERELGRGGMATVYLAQDHKHDRRVALKVLRPELSAALGPERFLREIHIAASLSHPHILALHDSGAAAGLLFYVMPYVDGESLRDRLDRDKQLPLEQALAIAGQVLSALGHAHQRGVVHRDIKPENLLLSRDPTQDGAVAGGWHCVVADFGIARALDAAGGEKLTETGLALGTPSYMSPEQASGGDEVDGRSDLYSLGCVLYEMLAGQPPFSGPTARAIMARHSLDAVPPIRTVRDTVPKSVSAAVVKALAKVPADRFATAAEFNRALIAPDWTVRPTLRVGARNLRWALPLGALVLAAGAAGAWVALHPLIPRIPPSVSRIAVLPFAPSVADTALARLGRDLAFTVSASLDEVGELRTVDAHAILAQAADPTAGTSLPAGAARGRRFGAGSVVHGSLARLAPDLVRLTFGLFTSDSLAPLVRASVTAAPDSVAQLTDSVSRALLRQIWQRGEPPTPSLEAALKTRSAPALRAFLQGERALVENHWSDAADAYANAVSADSTFWLPYWRYAFSRGYWEGAEIDSAVVKIFQAHRSELPAPDRLSIEAFMPLADSLSVTLARARAVTERFPDYWPGLLAYGDLLVHVAPILGTTVGDARAPLERAVFLNPRLTPGWEHLSWVYCKSRDSTGAARALEAALSRLKAGPTLEQAEGFDEILQLRLIARLAEKAGDADQALIDSVARTAARGGGAAVGMLGWCGYRRAQTQISQQILRLRPTAEVAAQHRRLLALNWAGRGAWDSVPPAVDDYAAHPPERWQARDAYALMVTGVWLGGLDRSEAVRRRDAARRLAERLPLDQGQPHLRAELAWLDGMLAWARHDPAGLESARRELEQVDRAWPSWRNPAWGRSLAAFQLALAGDRRRAGAALAALEWQRAERVSDVSSAQYLTALDRLAASRWLFEAGDTAQAARLLTWNEAWSSVSGGVGGAVFASVAYLERARIEEARGKRALARDYYREFLLRYDMPTAKLRHLVQEAKTALDRLSHRGA